MTKLIFLLNSHKSFSRLIFACHDWYFSADLRSLQRGNLSDRRSPVHQLPPAGSFSPRPPSPRDDKIRPPPPQHNAVGESTYARGGHGIFGQPKVR